MTTNLYIAAPFQERGNMPTLASRVEGLGYGISWKWWEVEEVGREGDQEFLETCARNDFLGVKNADLILLINSSKSEGKAVEQGVALALGKPILAVGRVGEHSNNVFHRMSNYIWVGDIETAMKVLGTVKVLEGWRANGK